MLDRWLGQADRRSISEFLDLCEVTVDETIGEHELENALGRELLRNYLGPAERAVLADTFQELGLDQLAEHIRTQKLPTAQIVRIGDFGEALTGVLFRRVRRYCVPVLKLRYKHRPDQPVQGSDLVAFRLLASPPVVASPEVKTYTTRDLQLGKKANRSLTSGLSSLPSTIQFVGARLLEQGNALGARVLALLTARHVVERHIVLIHDEAAWDHRIVDGLCDVVTEETEATVIRVKSLRSRIDAAYEAAPRSVNQFRSGELPGGE